MACLAAYGNGIYFSHFVMPAHAHERNLKPYAETFAEASAPGAELIFYGSIRNSIIYYHSRHMRQYEPDRLDEMVRYVTDRPDVYIIAQDLFFDEMLNALHRGTRVRWRLVDDEHPQFQLLTNANRDR